MASLYSGKHIIIRNLVLIILFDIKEDRFVVETIAAIIYLWAQTPGPSGFSTLEFGSRV